jgi:PAS domain S-box-containing protein
MMVVSVAVFAVIAPLACQPLPQVWAFIPIYESALVIGDLITAVMIFGQFNILRSRSLLVLGAGYLFTALMTIPHALTFPGLFSPTGLLGAGPQTTAWLYMFWHAGFPIAVIAYALLKNKNGGTAGAHGSAGRAILFGVSAVVGAVAAVTLLATVGQALLPSIMAGNKHAFAMTFVIATVWTLSLTALIALWLRRPHAVLDLWLMVVMCAWVIDIALSAMLNAGRFDLGFYAGRIYGLLAANVVLVILMLETGALYAQLVKLFAAEQRGRRHEAEERRRIFETSLDLILVVDRRGTFLRVSPSSMTILGYEPAEMAGHNAIEFLYPDDLDAIRPEMRRARHHGHLIRNFATRYLHKNGRIVSLAWSGVWSEPEQCYYFIGRDVTEQKRLERMKDEFIATASHELRTPITAIWGPLRLLSGGAGGELPDTAKRLIALAHANSDRLARLVNDILDVEKIESGRMSFDFQQINARSLVERAIEANRPLAEKHNVKVRLKTKAVACEVRTDPDRLAQAIANLLSNAVKFSPPGAEVMVSVETRHDHVWVAVRDHGPGIPDEFRPHLFEKFAQVDATDARQKGGVGLGLSIVKATMMRLGGDVGYEAAPSGGAIFHVDVPRWKADAKAERISELSSKVA